MDMKKIGQQICYLRKAKGLTQADLGERLGVSFQAVSKWERGETLPDITLLPALSDALETTIDNILRVEDRPVFKRRITVSQIKDGIECFEKIGELLGKDSYFYTGAIKGIDEKMNIDFSACFTDLYIKEMYIAEAIIQCIMNGAYIDPIDIKNSFEFENPRKQIEMRLEKYGIR